MREDFPAPVLPTIPIISPPAISQLIPFTTKSKPLRYLSMKDLKIYILLALNIVKSICQSINENAKAVEEAFRIFSKALQNNFYFGKALLS
jgi:hypothetical protein